MGLQPQHSRGRDRQIYVKANLIYRLNSRLAELQTLSQKNKTNKKPKLLSQSADSQQTSSEPELAGHLLCRNGYTDHKLQELRRARRILVKRQSTRTQTNFKTYYKATVIKIAQYDPKTYSSMELNENSVQQKLIFNSAKTMEKEKGF